MEDHVVHDSKAREEPKNEVKDLKEYIERLKHEASCREETIKRLDKQNKNFAPNGHVSITTFPPELYDMVASETFREDGVLREDQLTKFLDAPGKHTVMHLPYDKRVAFFSHWLKANTFDISDLDYLSGDVDRYAKQHALAYDWRTCIRSLQFGVYPIWWKESESPLFAQTLARYFNLKDLTFEILVMVRDNGPDAIHFNGMRRFESKMGEALASLPKLEMIRINPIYGIEHKNWRSWARKEAEALKAKLEGRFKCAEKEVTVVVELPPEKSD